MIVRVGAELPPAQLGRRDAQKCRARRLDLSIFKSLDAKNLRNRPVPVHPLACIPVRP